jgi:hypothetical protein
VADSFQPEHLAKLPFGMHDILGNAMGWDHSPSLAELSAGLEQLARRDLLERDVNSPMLVVNAPTTSSSRSRTPWSSRAEATPRCISSRAPATSRCRRHPRWCP